MDAVLSRTSDGLQSTKEDIEAMEERLHTTCLSIVRGNDKNTKMLLRLVEGRSISIVSIVRYSSLRIYLTCQTKQDLIRLRELYDSCELPGILSVKLNEMLHTKEYPRVSRVVVQYISLVDYCSCFDYFTGICNNYTF